MILNDLNGQFTLAQLVNVQSHRCLSYMPSLSLAELLELSFYPHDAVCMTLCGFLKLDLLQKYFCKISHTVVHKHEHAHQLMNHCSMKNVSSIHLKAKVYANYFCHFDAVLLENLCEGFRKLHCFWAVIKHLFGNIKHLYNAL